jgi:peroxiredoxin
MQCRSHAVQLGRLYDEFKVANCEILLILGEPLEKAKQYAQLLHLPFPVLADPQRMVYHQYGLEKALIFLQRTASIVVDREEIIRYIKSAINPMLWLQESRGLLDFVKSMLSGQ